MAKDPGPQIEDGYRQTANELATAIMLADFSLAESIVIDEILHHAYGVKKARAVEVRPTDLATRAGLDKSNVIRAIRNLVSGGVIAKSGDHEYTFNKHYREWKTPHGLLRITGRRIELCESRIRINSSKKEGGYIATQGVSTATDPGCQYSHPTVVAQPPSQAAPLTTPIEERTRNLDLREKEESQQRANDILPIKGNPKPEDHSERYLADKPADQRAYFAEALALLERTQGASHVAAELKARSCTEGVGCLECWQFLQAARVVAKPDKSKSFGFFLGCARKATWQEFLDSSANPHPATVDPNLMPSQAVKLVFHRKPERLAVGT